MRPDRLSFGARGAARGSTSSGRLPRPRRIVADEMTDRAPNPPEAIDPARAAAAARLPARIAFLGFGLIGGSIALALRAAGYAGTISAWTPSGRGPAEGVGRGAVEDASPSAPDALDGAELVVLAGPPLAIVGMVEAFADGLRESLDRGATITDVASTKSRILASADAAALRFVGGHPMAGREVSGAGNARAELFVDRPWVLVPGRSSTAGDLGRVESLAIAAGARPLRMEADEHDAAVAAISHLPLVMAAALVESVAGTPVGSSTWPLARRLAASGWADMTRLAKGDPEMGAGIIATNYGALADRLIALRDVLQTWIDRLELEPADAEVIRADLARVRSLLDEDEAS